MWPLLVINLFLYFQPLPVKSAWVEIPQVPSKKPETRHRPTQFVFGAPKVSFLDEKPTTAASNHRNIPATTPKIPATTLSNYRKIMTTTPIPVLTTTPQPLQRRNDEKVENTLAAPKVKNDKEKKPKNKNEDTYSGFLPLLRSIQETLTLNAKKSLKSKISFLTSLRDNLLTNIDERMSSLWKRSGDGSEARGYDDKEMDFPSNEGALMTIGFLTFAVFLIKLVLKLIHALKSKTVMANTTMMTGTATATTFIGRKKRGVGEEEAAKILQYIEEYKFT